MIARFDSQCPECGRRMTAGSTIVRGLHRKFVHPECKEGFGSDGRLIATGDSVDCVDWDARRDEAEYARGYNETRVAQMAGPAGSAAREQAYLEMEQRWAREGSAG